MTAKIIPLPVQFPRKRISVIMVSYHTGAPLFEAMRAVLSDGDIHELILIDNGNSQATRKRLYDFSAQYPRMRLVQGHGNIGFARGCNYGAKLSKGEYILFLNPDAIINKGSAMAMADCGASLQKPWITGGYLETVAGQEQRGSRRSELTPMSAVVSFTPMHKLPWFDTIHMERTVKPTSAVPMPIVSGACLMMDRESFNILGGFDKHYFLHVEDIDICKRARGAGGDVYFVPQAKALHYGATSQVRVQKVEFEKFKGFVRYFWNYSTKWWAKCLLVLAVPFMFIAIMGRAWWLALQAVWRG